MKELFHLFDLFLEHPFFVDPVFRQIRAKVGSPRNRRLDLAWFQNVEDGAWFRVTNTEEKKMKGLFSWKHHEVSLYKAGHKPCGRLLPFPGPDHPSQLFGRGGNFAYHAFTLFARIRILSNSFSSSSFLYLSLTVFEGHTMFDPALRRRRFLRRCCATRERVTHE